jgi:protein-tyrosine phosphatase
MWLFTKKYFLRDLLTGAVDIHNHILPCIDDGAPTLETSLEMLQLFKELGFKECIATPHIMADYYGNTATSIQETYNTTNAALAGSPFEGYITSAASEYMLDDGFETLLNKNELLFLKDRILLTELSYFQKPNNLLELCYQMVTSNIHPILAHPERYGYFKSIADFKDLKQRGFLLQLNILSLSGHYGDAARKMGEQLLLANMVDYIATDAHRPEHLEKMKDLTIPKKLITPLELICEGQRLF